MAFRCNDGTGSMQSGFCGASEFSFDLENDYRRSPRKQNVQQQREDRSVQQQQPPTPVKENLSKDEWTNADPLEASENEVPQADDTFMVVVNEEEFQTDGKDEEHGEHLGEHINEKEEEHAYNYSDMTLGSICCWCVPTPLSSFADCMHRTLYWFKLNKEQLLAGLAVAIGQVPQVTSYAVLAGVSPSVAIQATWIMNVITSIFGGRPGMVSGTTALSVIPLIDLIQTDGISYMFYAIMFAGMLQMAFGILKLGRVLRFLPHSAMVGYVNAMAVIIIFSQLKYFKLPHNGINAEIGDGRLYQYQFNFIKVLYDSTPWVSRSTIIAMSVEAALALVICFAFPRISKAIPSTALAFFILTALEWSVARYTGFTSVIVGDYVSLSGPSFPIPILMDSKYTLPPINYDTWKKVWPCGLSLFTNAIIDSLLTYRVCSERVKTRGSSSRMAFGQGLAQFASAFLGSMGGAGSLDQTVINLKSGGQTVLSTFVAGLILFVIAAGAYPAVNIVPLSAVVGVMFYSAINIFQWDAFTSFIAAIFPRKIRDFLFLDCKVNRIDSVIMLVVMAFTIFIDSATAACLGATLAVYAYSWDTSNQLEVDRVMSEGEDTVTYRFKGPIFFATYPVLLSLFTHEVLENDPKDVILFLKDAEILDWSGQLALKKLYLRIESCGKTVALSSLSESSRSKMEKNSSLWYGCVFLEMEEVEEEDLMSMKKSKSNVADEETVT